MMSSGIKCLLLQLNQMIADDYKLLSHKQTIVRMIAKLLILLVFLSFASANTTPHPPCTDSWSPDQYFIDLDRSPLSRWRQVITAKKSHIKALEQDLLKSSPYKYLLPLAQYVVGPVLSLFNNQFLEECRAIAHFSGVPFTTIVILQYMYELGTHSSGKMCSAVLVNRGDHVFHARNLDYSFPELLAQMSVTLHYRRNGSVIFTAVTQAGFTGVHTGIAHGKFTIDLNERDMGSIYASYWAYLTGHSRVTGFIRHVLTTAENYQQAVALFKTEKLISPCYLVTTGINGNEGAIITRHRNSVHDIYSLDDAAKEGRSFVVQTNYDRDIPDPERDQRRIPAEKRMDALGANTTMQVVLQKIMIEFPTFNIDTLLTSTLCAAKSYVNTTVWYK